MKRKIIKFILITIGILLITLPIVLKLWNSYIQITNVLKYKKQVEELSNKELEEEIKKQQDYNQKIDEEKSIDIFLKGEEKDEKKDENELDFDEAIAYISIPKVNIMLPIYYRNYKQNFK